MTPNVQVSSNNTIPTPLSFICYNCVRPVYLVLLSSARISVPVKLGLFNAKIHNENGRYIHRLIYQLNEEDLLCYSI